MKKARVAKLSLCSCGFPVLNEHIKLGTQYEVDLESEDDFTFICGGCGRVISVRGVRAVRAQNSGFLPLDIFEVS